LLVEIRRREAIEATHNTIASKALAVQTLLGLDRSGQDHGEGDQGVDGELHFEGCWLMKWYLEAEELSRDVEELMK